MNSSKGIFLLLFVLSILFTLSLIIYLPSSTPYSPYNPYDYGLSLFISRYNADTYYIEYIPRDIDTVILILEDYPRNISRYIDFVRDGGDLIILDNMGYSNDILSEAGVGSYVYNATVLDEVYKYRNRFNVRADSSLGNYSIVLYMPGFIEVSNPDVEILARSSIYSYVDMDGDGNYTVGEPIGSRILSIRYRYGMGSITVVSSRYLLCNEFLADNLNNRFLDDILSNGRIVIDLSTVSHTSIDILKHNIYSLGRGWWRNYLYASILILLSGVGLIVWRESEG